MCHDVPVYIYTVLYVYNIQVYTCIHEQMQNCVWTYVHIHSHVCIKSYIDTDADTDTDTAIDTDTDTATHTYRHKHMYRTEVYTHGRRGYSSEGASVVH